MKDLLQELGIKVSGEVFQNLKPPELTEAILSNEDSVKSNTGAISIKTGKYTGRAAKSRFFVKDGVNDDKINWGKVNIGIDEEVFNQLHEKVTNYLSEKDKLYIFDGRVGTSDCHNVNVRVVNELASQNLCAYNMFVRLDESERENFEPDFTVISAPTVIAEGEGGIEGEAFICIHLAKKLVIIGGSAYAGEMKKSLFTIMNFLMPEEGILPMHCGSNMSDDGSTALFFGLSGTGKTTLSTDPGRKLIGDDEHGWCKDGIFNFEGGCYAKTYKLDPKFEPQIHNAIKEGAVVENVVIDENGCFDFFDKTFTENGRVSYPMDFIDNSELSGIGGHPKTILFLTADAFGVLPPVSKLDFNQAMYHFISGYTSKLAGTEAGITEPQATFSSFFGAPFMPQKPMVYANLLKKYIQEYGTNVYLINTGWTGGSYGVGHRFPIDKTRAMVNGALDGSLDQVEYKVHPIFNLSIPVSCPNVEPELLDPINTWDDKGAYTKKAKQLAQLFAENMGNLSNIPQDIIQAGPQG